MIKNIVFDMGNVLVGYDAMRVCSHFIEDEEDRKAVRDAVFISPEWLLLDMGLISEEEALKRIGGRIPQRLQPMAKLCMDHWTEFNMWPIEEMREVVEHMKRQGFGIYLCSNASNRLPECYREVIPAIELFNGVLFSAPEKCMKPQRQIYEILFSRFGLKPEECFFVDDMQLNIDGARECGMDGYCFEDGDIEKLKGVLYGL